MFSRFLAIKLGVIGLKCDTPTCTWQDMSIPRKDYPKWIDAPCPCCGASLMTPANFRSLKIMEALVLTINVVCFPVMVVRVLLGKKEYYQEVKVDSRPDGSVSFK
jgi:hypothetical protein